MPAASVMASRLPASSASAKRAPAASSCASSPLSPVSSATNGANGFDQLDEATSVATFAIGTHTYAIVASQRSNGVQLIDVSVPSNPIAVASAADGDTGFDELNVGYGPNSVATFVIGDSTYAIVASYDDNGVQLMEFVA